MGGSNLFQNIKCHECNKLGHIAKFYRSKNVKVDLVKKNDPVKESDTVEMKKEMINIWKNKEENEVKDEFIPASCANVSSEN